MFWHKSSAVDPARRSGCSWGRRRLLPATTGQQQQRGAHRQSSGEEHLANAHESRIEPTIDKIQDTRCIEPMSFNAARVSG